MDRVPQRLAARSRKIPTLLICPCGSGLFNHRSPMGCGSSSTTLSSVGSVNSDDVRMRLSFFSRHRLWRCFFPSDSGRNVFGIFKFDAQIRRQAAVVEKPRTARADKQRRGPSTTRGQALCHDDPYVRRSAQDDDFVVTWRSQKSTSSRISMSPKLS
jgi:hypothetical protein